jgi:hypothetical protein
LPETSLFIALPTFPRAFFLRSPRSLEKTGTAEQTLFFLMISSTCVFQRFLHSGTRLEQAEQNRGATPARDNLRIPELSVAMREIIYAFQNSAWPCVVRGSSHGKIQYLLSPAAPSRARSHKQGTGIEGRPRENARQKKARPDNVRAGRVGRVLATLVVGFDLEHVGGFGEADRFRRYCIGITFLGRSLVHLVDSSQCKLGSINQCFGSRRRASLSF